MNKISPVAFIFSLAPQLAQCYTAVSIFSLLFFPSAKNRAILPFPPLPLQLFLAVLRKIPLNPLVNSGRFFFFFSSQSQ